MPLGLCCPFVARHWIQVKDCRYFRKAELPNYSCRFYRACCIPHSRHQMDRLVRGSRSAPDVLLPASGPVGLWPFPAQLFRDVLPSPAAGSRIVPMCRAASCKKKSRSLSDSTAVLELTAQPQEQRICSFALKRAIGALLESKDAAAVVSPGKGGTQTRGPQIKPLNTANLCGWNAEAISSCMRLGHSEEAGCRASTLPAAGAQFSCGGVRRALQL